MYCLRMQAIWNTLPPIHWTCLCLVSPLLHHRSVPSSTAPLRNCHELPGYVAEHSSPLYETSGVAQMPASSADTRHVQPSRDRVELVN